MTAIDVKSFSRYRTNFSISQLLASSMLPTSVILSLTNAFSQYETFGLVFIGDTTSSFRDASSGMISIRYNFHSDLTLSQTPSEDKALDTWSVRLEIPPIAFVSLHLNGCVCKQFMYDDKQFCQNFFSSSHISSTSDAANMLFAFMPISRDLKELKYFLFFIQYIINIYRQKFSCRYFCLIFVLRLCKYFDLINLLIVFHRRIPFLYICILMGTLFEIFSRAFQSLSQSILQMKGTKRYLLRSIFFLICSYHIRVFFTYEKSFVFGPKI